MTLLRASLAYTAKILAVPGAILLGLAWLLLMASLTGCSGGSGGSNPQGDPGDERASASSIRFVDLEGLDAALEEYRGKGVLLNFWAIWCVPCVAELPELLEVGREAADHGGVVLTVSYDLMIPGETRESAKSKLETFTAEREMNVPVFVYEAEDYSAIDERFSLPGGIPITLAIDKSGQVVDRQNGAAGKERFEEMMARALR